MTALTFLRGIFTEALSLPLINLVDLFVYYGPFVFFILLFWKQICERALEFNMGIAFSILLMMLVSLSSESRKCINFIGMMVFLVLLVAPSSRLEVSKVFAWFFVGLSLIFSKCWFHIDMPTTTPSLGKELLSSAWQDYFMNFGIWMSPFSYVLQVVCIVLSLGFITGFLVKKSSLKLYRLNFIIWLKHGFKGNEATY